MSNPETTTVKVRLRDQNHPSGQRTRAGITVHIDARDIKVTEAQLEALQNDPYIQVLRSKAPVQPEASTKKEPEDVKDPIIAPVVKLERLNKGQLIDILVNQLGQVPEKDFQPDATNDNLMNLIRVLQETKATEGEDDGAEDQDDDDGDE